MGGIFYLVGWFLLGFGFVLVCEYLFFPNYWLNHFGFHFACTFACNCWPAGKLSLLSERNIFCISVPLCALVLHYLVTIPGSKLWQCWPAIVNASYFPQVLIYSSLFQGQGTSFKARLTSQSMLWKLQEAWRFLLPFSFFFLDCSIGLFNLTSSDDQNVLLKGLNNNSDDFCPFGREMCQRQAVLFGFFY